MKHRAEIESKEYVKESADKIMKEVSREYRFLLRQFMDFRKRTWDVIDCLKDYGDRVHLSEKMAA